LSWPRGADEELASVAVGSSHPYTPPTRRVRPDLCLEPGHFHVATLQTELACRSPALFWVRRITLSVVGRYVERAASRPSWSSRECLVISLTYLCVVSWACQAAGTASAGEKSPLICTVSRWICASHFIPRPMSPCSWIRSGCTHPRVARTDKLYLHWGWRCPSREAERVGAERRLRVRSTRKGEGSWLSEG
jgi:hypothetical protein